MNYKVNVPICAIYAVLISPDGRMFDFFSFGIKRENSNKLVIMVWNLLLGKVESYIILSLNYFF